MLGIPVQWTLCFVYALITLDTVIPYTCITATHILLHMTSIISCSWTLIHGYIITLDTVTQILCTLLFHVLTSMWHIFSGIHAIDYFCIPIPWPLLLLYGLLLHRYSYILVTWLFPVTDIDTPVTGHECCWYAMCETKCHMDLSHGGHL